MSDHHAELLRMIAERSARVAVIGLGYVGLPLVLLFEEAGFEVTGLDVASRTSGTSGANGSPPPSRAGGSGPPPTSPRSAAATSS
jgi:glycine/D-amino acid oxidase-like deaminating enzyme